MSTETLTTTKPFVISRTFAATRDVVWKALTEPAQMQQWFSPKGFTSRVKQLDLRPGGLYHYCLTSPDGKEMWGRMIYVEIVAPERLVYINAFSNADGGLARHPMSPTWPMEMFSIFELTEKDGKTTLTITWTPHNPTPEELTTFEGAYEGMKQGWTGSLDQLTQYLANK